MTLLPSTTALLLCLLAATLLGAGIGACIWHLRLARRHERALQRLHRSGARERGALGAMLSQEREVFVLKYEQQTRRLREEHERAERAVARADELFRREGEQARRVAKLEASAAALDARPSALRRHHSLGEDRLPVLRRRVDSVMPSLGDELLTLDGDREIPVLAESDLPDSVDDLLRELLDIGRTGVAFAYGGRSDREAPGSGDPDATDPDLAGLGIGGSADERDEG